MTETRKQTIRGIYAGMEDGDLARRADAQDREIEKLEAQLEALRTRRGLLYDEQAKRLAARWAAGAPPTRAERLASLEHRAEQMDRAGDAAEAQALRDEAARQRGDGYAAKTKTCPTWKRGAHWSPKGAGAARRATNARMGR